MLPKLSTTNHARQQMYHKNDKVNRVNEKVKEA